MSIKNSRDEKILELRRQLEEVEAEARADEKAEQKRIDQAKRYAGNAHTRTMLALYDLLGIEPEYPTTRRRKDKDGNEVEREVAVDRDETVRSGRLLTIIETLVDSADQELLDRLAREDEEGRLARKPTPKPVKAKENAESGEEPDDGDTSNAQSESFSGELPSESFDGYGRSASAFEDTSHQMTYA
ncbi:hypothetical protein VR010_14070 [Actinomycetaceae bacterium L2_0104]